MERLKIGSKQNLLFFIVKNELFQIIFPKDKLTLFWVFKPSYFLWFADMNGNITIWLNIHMFSITGRNKTWKILLSIQMIPVMPH